MIHEIEGPGRFSTCRSSACHGLAVSGHNHCLEHIGGHAFDVFLSTLRPGSDLVARATPFTLERFSPLLSAFRERGSGRLNFGRLDFRGAEIPGGASFHGAIFNDKADFRGATFHRITQPGYPVDRIDANFEGVEFNRAANFQDAHFMGESRFRKAKFAREANFRNSTFHSESPFDKVKFHGKALFDLATFQVGAVFAGTRFSQLASFNGSKFYNGSAWFGGAHFAGEAWFDQAKFISSVAVFGGGGDAELGGHSEFDSATFEGRALFRYVLFRKDAWFGSTAPGAGGAQFRARADFLGSKFEASAKFGSVAFGDRSRIGPCRAKELILGQVRTGLNTILQWNAEEISAYQMSCPDGVNLQLSGGISVDASQVRSLGALTLHFRNGEMSLTGAAFDAPAIITAPGTGDADTKLLGLARVDTTNLTLTGINLQECHFLDSYNLDQLRIDGPPNFAESPHGRGWSRRKTLAEERAWRVRYDRRPDGWAPEASPESGEAEAGAENDADGPEPGKADDEPQPPTSRGLSAPLSRPDRLRLRVRNAADHRQAVRKRRTDRLGEKARYDAARIQAVYRNLRKSRENQKDEPGAADFYYGEMEMRRLAAPPKSVERRLLIMYWLLSGYGLRATRALAALVFVFVFGVVGFATFGFAPSNVVVYRAVIDNRTGHLDGYSQVTAAGPHPGWADAADESAESVLSVFRSPPARPLNPGGQALQIALRLLGPLFLGLAVFAVRGRLKR